MKRNWKNSKEGTNDEVRGTKSLIAVIVAILLLIGCGRDTAHDHDTYTCPMHPTVVSDRPATCPVCGMDLVRKARAGEEVAITEDLARLIKSPNEAVVADTKTIRPHYKSMPVFVDVQGVVTYDTRNIFTIASRVNGRLEKVYLKYAFQPVSKGQKIAEVYSPELITAQRELLFLLQNDAGNKTLIDAAQRKLELLGLTSVQINNLIAKKESTQTFGIYSPYSGYLITGENTPATSVAMPSPSAPGGMSDGMGSASNASANTSAAPESEPPGQIIREGSYVAAGQTLFRIVNTRNLRIELDLPASQAATVKRGNKLALDYGNGSTETATVDFVQPFFSEGQDFVKLRVFTSNTRDLHIGHLVTAKIELPASESLWLPKEAVLDLGTGKIVLLKDRGVLKPRNVVTGIAAEGLIQIISGLASSDEVAANAQYLIDSESFIKTEK